MKWDSSRGVSVTFHHRGRPYLTVLYPGTTQDDYDRFLLAGSKGRWVHAFYYRRPYVPLPLDV